MVRAVFLLLGYSIGNRFSLELPNDDKDVEILTTLAHAGITIGAFLSGAIDHRAGHLIDGLE